MKQIVFLFLTFSSCLLANQKILLIGDSLTAGYGVSAKDNYPNQLQLMIRNSGMQYKVVNAGISGDTTAGGKSKISGYLLKHKPKIVVIALGANDAFRGKSVRAMKQNLEFMIKKVIESNGVAVLAGMHAPPNYGKKYTKRFRAIYEKLKTKYQLPFIPFLLEGVAAEKSLNLGDGIHPNPNGYRKISKLVFNTIKKIHDENKIKKKVLQKK